MREAIVELLLLCVLFCLVWACGASAVYAIIG